MPVMLGSLIISLKGTSGRLYACCTHGITVAQTRKEPSAPQLRFLLVTEVSNKVLCHDCIYINIGRCVAIVG